MGASAVLMAAGYKEGTAIPKSVIAVIADCAFTSVRDIIKSMCQKLHYPVHISYALAWLGALVFGHMNISSTAVASAEAAVSGIRIPVLFIHGSNDSVVPSSMCDRLYNACTAYKKQLVISGADHAVNALTAYNAYADAVGEFIKKCGKGYYNENLKIKSAVITAVTAIVAATASFGLYTAWYYHDDEAAAAYIAKPTEQSADDDDDDDGTIGRSPLIDTLNQNFKVQLPVYRDGSTTAVKEVGKGCSIAFDDYSDEYFYYAPADGAIVFYTPVFGAKTANTKYTRSELREISGSSTRDNWGWDGKHTLVTTESVTKIPANGKVMVCQVHAIQTDGGNGPVPVKVIYEGNAERIAVSFTISPAGKAADRYYFDNVKIGQKFTTAIDITDGRAMVTIESNGEKKSFEHDFKSQYENYAAWSEYLNYFKAGNYIQDDSDSSDGAASEVRMYDIAVSHR